MNCAFRHSLICLHLNPAFQKRVKHGEYSNNAILKIKYRKKCDPCKCAPSHLYFCAGFSEAVEIPTIAAPHFLLFPLYIVNIIPICLLCPASHSSIHVSNHPSTHPFIQPSIQLFIKPSTHQFIYSTIHPTIYSTIHPSIM